MAAKDSQAGEGPAALEDLCRTYWRSVYLFIRSRGIRPDDAEDLTQEFFYQLLDGHYLRAVDGPEKGRLRSFLCVVLKRFLADEAAKRATRKRGGDWQPIPIDVSELEEHLQAMPDCLSAPEAVFDRQWAQDLIDASMKALEADYAGAGKAGLFRALKPMLQVQQASPANAELAASLGMSEGALKVAVHRLRQRFRDCVRSCISDTLAEGEDADEELRYLRSMFASLA